MKILLLLVIATLLCGSGSLQRVEARSIQASAQTLPVGNLVKAIKVCCVLNLSLYSVIFQVLLKNLIIKTSTINACIDFQDGFGNLQFRDFCSGLERLLSTFSVFGSLHAGMIIIVLIKPLVKIIIISENFYSQILICWLLW